MVFITTARNYWSFKFGVLKKRPNLFEDDFLTITCFCECTIFIDQSSNNDDIIVREAFISPTIIYILRDTLFMMKFMSVK